MRAVVRHTMQALPLTSMSSSNKTKKSACTGLRRTWYAWLFPLLVLAIAHGVITAQQTAAPGAGPCVPSAPCASKSSSLPAKRNKRRATKILVDARVPDDSAIEKLLEPYSAKVRALDVVIGRLEGELVKGGVGAGSLGNFVADGIRSQASIKLGKPIMLAITNSGGLRKNTIAEGELRASDIFELLPFENALVEVDLTGEQLLKLLGVIVDSRDAQSGARIKYRMAGDRPEMVIVRLIDAQGREIEIDPKATYTIVTIDYLLNLASGRYSILQQGKNVKPLGITIRDAIMDYVKAETAAGRPVRAQLDGRFSLTSPDAPKPEGQPK